MSDWDAEEVDGVRVRNTQDPDEAQVMDDCTIAWYDYDKVGHDPLVDDMSPEELDDHLYESHISDEMPMPGRPEDLRGWDTLTDLEKEAIEAIDYGHSISEHAEMLKVDDDAVRNARYRARTKLWRAYVGKQGKVRSCDGGVIRLKNDWRW